MESLANNMIFAAVILIVSFAVFFIMAFRGSNILLCGLVAALLACLGSANGWQTALTEDFINGISNLLKSLLLLYLGGSVLGCALEITGCSQRIGETLVRWLGKDNIAWALFIFYTILCIAGLNSTWFMFVALSLPLLRQADLPKSLGLLIAGCSFASFSLNFSPHAQNGIYATALGTPISFSNAPLLTIVCGIVSFGVLILLIRRELKLARKEGRGFHHEGEIPTGTEMQFRPSSELPGFGLAIVIIVVMIALLIVLQNVFGWNGNAAAVTSMFVMAIVTLIVCHKHIQGNTMKAVTNALLQPMPMLMGAAFVGGYANILNGNMAFSALLQKILTLNMNPYILVFVVIAVLAALTGNSITPHAMFISTLMQPIVAMGANPAAVQRLAICTSVTFDSLPHSYMAHINMGVYGHTMKTGYKYMFQSSVIMTTITAVVCLICCVVFY